jgi:luciferase family oxidoreductase group 1
LSIVEEFGLLDALYPGRFDLGLGRSGQARTSSSSPSPAPVGAHVVDGLLIPAPFSFASLLGSPKFALFASLLQQPGATSLPLAAILDQIDVLVAGTYADDEGNVARAVPGEGADLQVWILGSSGGESARVAGARGLPFAANYHVAPAQVLEAVAAYRESFVPSASLAAPKVMVSADVVVAEDSATARRLAAPYGAWVRSIRTGEGAIPFPSPSEALSESWSEADRVLVADRLDTQFVGSASSVASRLRVLQRVTGADELLVTTITHSHGDRVRSFELLAKEWFGGS